MSQVRDEDVDIATTPRELVAQIGGRSLYRIAIGAPDRVKTPVMVVYAMVGHWTILDLQPDRSFLRNLAEGGCEVYMLDWGHPTAADQFDDFSDLVDIYMDGFVEAIRDRHDIESDQPARHLPGRRLVVDLCLALSREDPQPDHLRDAGRFSRRQAARARRPRLHERLGAQSRAGGNGPDDRFVRQHFGRGRRRVLFDDDARTAASPNIA